MDDIVVKFGADIRDLTAALNKSNKLIEEQQKKARDSQRKTNKTLDEGTRAAANAGKSIERFAKGAGTALSNASGEAARFGGVLGEVGTLLNGLGASGAVSLGALAVAAAALAAVLATIVIFWDSIREAATGVTFETREALKALEKQASEQEQTLALLNASDNILKQQGKSQLEINNLKIGELKTLANIKRAQLGNLKDALAGAKAQEAVYRRIVGAIVDFFIIPIQVTVDTVAAILGGLARSLADIDPTGTFAGLAVGVDQFENFTKTALERTRKRLTETFTPDITSDFKEQIDERELDYALFTVSYSPVPNLFNIE